MLKYIYSESLFNTLYIEIKQLLKKFPLDKINGIKNAFFFLWRAPTHHTFTFDLQFFYEIRHKCVGFSFSITSRFYVNLCFYLTKIMNSLTFKLFKLKKLKFSECHFFSIVTFKGTLIQIWKSANIFVLFVLFTFWEMHARDM